MWHKFYMGKFEDSGKLSKSHFLLYVDQILVLA